MNTAHSFSGQSVEQANAWLARFAPLLQPDECRDAASVRAALNTLADLKRSAPSLQASMERESPSEALTATFQQAVAHLSDLEREYRVRLAQYAPGDPKGVVNLETLQAKMAERVAEKELGINPHTPLQLDLVINTPNAAAAGGMGCFSVGWLSFTTFHCVMMIGGMYKAMGAIALALLAFYAIFFAVGIGMAAGAITSLSTKTVTITRERLTITTKLGPWVRVKEFVLGENSRATVVERLARQKSGPKREILIPDATGKEIRLGGSLTDEQVSQKALEINRYMSASQYPNLLKVI